MSTLLNKIVFTGEALDGRYIEDVRRAAEIRLGMSPSELDVVFSGRRVVLKKDLTEAQAERYIRELAKLGMHVVRTPQTGGSAVSAQLAESEVTSLKAQMLAQLADRVGEHKRSGLFGIFGSGSRAH